MGVIYSLFDLVKKLIENHQIAVLPGKTFGMEKDCYQEIIAEVSKKLAQKINAQEKDLAPRATLIDKDIAEIVQDIGLQTTKRVLENTRDEIIVKKNKRG